MSITRWEAIEDAIYKYWDNLDAQERLNWLEPYGFENIQKVIMLPLDEILVSMDFVDKRSLSVDLMDEFDYTL